MRAVYIAGLQSGVGEIIIIEGDEFRHLKLSSRVSPDEQVLVLSGSGLSYLCKIEELQKKSLILRVAKKRTDERERVIDLVVGQTKKDALENIVSLAVELGVRRLYLAVTEFSQNQKINFERLERIIIASMKQSNNPFFLDVKQLKNLKDFNYEAYGNVFLFHPIGNGPLIKPTKVFETEAAIFIGPEGGFSEGEIDDLKKISNIRKVILSAPILRAPTAVAASIGWLLSQDD